MTKAAMTSCPEPGIYYDIPNAVYQAWNAVSSSPSWSARREE